MKCFNYILDLPDSFLKIIITLLISLILILGFFLNNIFIAVVDGSSMEDTIHHGDVLIINKKSYSTSSPKRYDIVNIYAPCKYDNFLVKRIIGLPGDTIEINNSEVYDLGDGSYGFIVNKYYYPEGKPEPAFICQYLVDKESWKVKEVKEGIKKELN